MLCRSCFLAFINNASNNTLPPLQKGVSGAMSCSCKEDGSSGKFEAAKSNRYSGYIGIEGSPPIPIELCFNGRRPHVSCTQWENEDLYDIGGIYSISLKPTPCQSPTFKTTPPTSASSSFAQDASAAIM